MPNIQDKCFLGRFGDFSLYQLFSNANQWMHLGAAGCDSLIFWLPLTFARENELTSCVDTGQYYNVSGCCCLGQHQVPDGHKAIQAEEEWPTACCCFLPTKARSTRNPGCYWALIQNLRQSSFDFKTCLPVISTPSAPIDPGQRQVWEKLKTKSRMFAVSCHSHIMHTACFPQEKNMGETF